MRLLFVVAMSFLALPAQAEVQWITDKGGRVDWSDQNLIAFDRLGDNKTYDIYTMKPDGTDVHCVTCARAGLPHHNLGNPAWSPSGEYLVFEAEKDEHPPIKFYLTTPGAGTYNDLWVMNVKTGNAAMLRQVQTCKDYGILHPHSPPTARRFHGASNTSRSTCFLKVPCSATGG